MDACRLEIGRKAAEIIAYRQSDDVSDYESIVELQPTINFGETLKRK